MLWNIPLLWSIQRKMIQSVKTKGNFRMKYPKKNNYTIYGNVYKLGQIYI